MKNKDLEQRLPGFDSEQSARSEQNSEAARRRNLFYDEESKVYKSCEDRAIMRDKYGQPVD